MKYIKKCRNYKLPPNLEHLGEELKNYADEYVSAIITKIIKTENLNISIFMCEHSHCPMSDFTIEYYLHGKKYIKCGVCGTRTLIYDYDRIYSMHKKMYEEFK